MAEDRQGNLHVQRLDNLEIKKQERGACLARLGLDLVQVGGPRRSGSNQTPPKAVKVSASPCSPPNWSPLSFLELSKLLLGSCPNLFIWASLALFASLPVLFHLSLRKQPLDSGCF
jgi:hypothetical protein